MRSAGRPGSRPGAPDRRDVRRKPGSLRDHDGVHVADAGPGLARKKGDTLEEQGAVGAPPLLGVFRKVLAERPAAGCAEESVRHGVQEDVAVGVPGEARFVGDLDATQAQRPPRPKGCASKPRPTLTSASAFALPASGSEPALPRAPGPRES